MTGGKERRFIKAIAEIAKTTSIAQKKKVH